MTTTVADVDTSFDYKYADLSDLQVVTTENPKTGKRVASGIVVNDERYAPTGRFWNSLFSRYGFNNSFFRYFDHKEVFERITRVNGKDRLRLCVENKSGAKPSSNLLAVSSPDRAIAGYDDLSGLIDQYRGRSVNYHDGVVESTHTLARGSSQFDVAGDMFDYRFTLATPIDGYGMPSIYLSLLRQVCANGMVGYARAFRSELRLGKGEDDIVPSLARAFEGFNNEEGFAALRQRIESSAVSWASVYEAQGLYNLLVRQYGRGGIRNVPNGVPNGETDLMDGVVDGVVDDGGAGSSQIIRSFHNLTGDISKIYGLANIDALSAKRQRQLPVKCTVYDMINFATEAATHHANAGGGRALQGWCGTLVSNEFDLEGTKSKLNDFGDFLIDRKLEGGLTGLN